MLSNKGFIIEKRNLTEKEVIQIKNNLTVTPENFQSAICLSPFHIFRESPHKLRVPRFYGMTRFPDVKQSFLHTNIDLEFNGCLKENLQQPKAVDACIQSLKSCGGGVLSLPTGYGKTTCALAIASKMKMKTIIIVHKEFLMNQWKERIQQFLPSASIGIIRQSTLEVDKDITIAMLQTLCMKKFPKTTFDSFGLTIIDETHHICSRVFSTSMFLFTTKYILGLSATPERKDNLTHVLHWFIGPLCFSIKRQNEASVHVQQIHFVSPEYQKDPPINAANKVNLPEAINVITSLENRNDLIIQLLSSSIAEDRKIIVLTDRRFHCETLLKSFSSKFPHVSMGLYMGGMKQHVLKENEKCDVLFATFSLAHEGLDIPKLDTLILATPKSDVVQSCGRILRESGIKKQCPLIFDIVDAWGPFLIQAQKRKRFYKQSGFYVVKIANGDDSKLKKTKLSSFSFVEEE